jgi:hypothetical protein
VSPKAGIGRKLPALGRQSKINRVGRTLLSVAVDVEVDFDVDVWIAAKVQKQPQLRRPRVSAPHERCIELRIVPATAEQLVWRGRSCLPLFGVDVDRVGRTPLFVALVNIYLTHQMGM